MSINEQLKYLEKLLKVAFNQNIYKYIKLKTQLQKQSSFKNCNLFLIHINLCLQMSDWDRFAAEEYELLVAEEGNADGMDEM